MNDEYVPWWQQVSQDPEQPAEPVEPVAATPGEADPWPASGRATRTSRPLTRGLSAATAAVLVLVGGLAGAGGALLATRHDTPTATSGAAGIGNRFAVPNQLPARPQPQAQVPGGSSGTADVTSVGQAVAPGVVDINTWIGYQNAQAAGTGMVLTPDGEILTNNHVIAGATKISVTDVGNGRTYPATVVGYDRSRDIAVLQLSGASGLQTVTTGDSTQVRVGEGVVAIGNAGGTGGEPTYAGGTVTGLEQQITASDDSDGTSEHLVGLIQTDANVVPGDSGGPLADGQGQVIGMDTAGSSHFRFRGGGAGGDAYAIPINDALQVAKQIVNGVSSTTVHVGPTALLGVEVVAADGQGGQGGQGSAGAQIAGVVEGEPAARAGLAAGDTITALDGHPIDSPDALSNVMITEHPGATVRVDFLDTSGAQRSVTVQLSSGPPQ